MSLSSCKVEYVGSTTIAHLSRKDEQPRVHTRKCVHKHVCVCVLYVKAYIYSNMCVIIFTYVIIYISVTVCEVNYECVCIYIIFV